MQSKSLGQKLIGDWGTKTIVTIAIGAALFGVLMVFGIPIVTNTNAFTPSFLIPVVVGSLYGPLPAFLTCFLGNIIADLIGGWGMWFDWSIGNGFVGLFAGMLPFYGANIQDGIFKVKHAIIYAVVVVAGNFVSLVGLTPLLTRVLYGGDMNVTYLQAFVAWGGNSFTMVVVGIPLLLIMARRYRARANLSMDEPTDDA